MSDFSNDPIPPPVYALGHSDSELERLTTQARLIDPITRRFFSEAGIVPGMRVLDVGSGAGDVALLVHDLVGEAGEIVGIDRAAAGLAVARSRADARSLHNVSFREGDLNQIKFEQPFDAIVGRYVLQHIADPGVALRKLVGHLRSGGIVAFHELDWDGVRSLPPAPTHDQCCRWCIETLQLLGAETQMGSKLYATFVAAGLPAPSMRLEAVIAGGANSSDRLHLAAELARSLLPAMERLGVATASTLDIETLAVRMQNEVVANGSVITGHWQVGAWSRVD
jgi:ubiquinone/menaquinone biosynthesis C-methylase UbiE